MRRYQDNDYALNKHSEGIVYRFANGIEEVTLEKFITEDPDKTKSDFATFKAESDAIYKEQDRNGYRQTWKNTGLDGFETKVQCASPSAEEIIIDTLIDAPEKEKRQRERVKIAKQALASLTDVQRKRYLLHVVKELNETQIAEIEHTTQQAVSKSLVSAKKKIKKFLVSTLFD